MQFVARSVVPGDGGFVQQVHLADCGPITGVLVQHPPYLSQPLVGDLDVVQGHMGSPEFDMSRRIIDREIVPDHVDDIHAEPVDPAIQPEPQRVQHGGLHFGNIPLQVGLVHGEVAQVVLASRLIELPGGVTGRKRRIPVGRRLIPPHVPVGLGVGAAGPALEEPWMLIAGVVRHPIQHDPQIAVVGLVDQVIQIGQRAEDRVDIAVVADVVPEVGHRRSEDRRDPDHVDAQPLQVIKMFDDATQGADARGRTAWLGVLGEAARIDLIDHPSLPPRVGRAHLCDSTGTVSTGWHTGLSITAEPAAWQVAWLSMSVL